MNTARGDLLKRITARPDVFNGKPGYADICGTHPELAYPRGSVSRTSRRLARARARRHSGLHRLRARGDSRKFPGAGVSVR